MSDRRFRTFSFNVSNPEEREMYDFLETRKNVSSYIKDLIKNDLLRRYAEKIKKQEKAEKPSVKQETKTEKPRQEITTRRYKGNSGPKTFL